MNSEKSAPEVTSLRPDESLPMLARIITEVVHRIGAKLMLDPDWKYAGQITFVSGKRAYFRGSSLDINPHGASQIATDKDFAAFFMRTMGLPALKGETFFSDEWCETIGSNRNAEAAVSHARDASFPLVVKPNSASQGRGVFVVETESELRRALHACFALDRVVLLQPFLQGRDYRVVVLGDEVISAYERIPLNVIGDGSRTISELLQAKADAFHVTRGRATKIPFGDSRIEGRLARTGHTLESIPSADETIFLLDHANLSSGGDAVDVTDSLSADLKNLCIDTTRMMGLRLCGVDLIIDGDVSENRPVHILEVNSSPGLDNYAAIGPAQWSRVLDLYSRVLTFIETSL